MRNNETKTRKKNREENLKEKERIKENKKTEKDKESEKKNKGYEVRKIEDCFACVHIHLQLILFLKSAVVGDSSTEGAIPSKQGEPSPPPIQTR